MEEFFDYHRQYRELNNVAIQLMHYHQLLSMLPLHEDLTLQEIDPP